MATEIAFELPYTEWNWRIGVYVAMIGIAGGAYLTGYVADLLSARGNASEHGRIAKYGYLVGLLGLAIGPPVLLSHLATPFRAMLIPLTMTNLGSWMAIGAYMLLGFGLGSFLMFAWVAFGRNRPHSPTVAEGSEGTLAADGGRDVSSDGGAEDGPARAATGGTTGGIRGILNRIGLLDRLDALADYTRPSEPIRLAIGGVFAIFAAGVLVYSAMAYGSGATERVALWDKTFLVPVQILGGLGAGLAVSVGLTAVADRSVTPTVQRYSLAAAGLLAATLVAVLATVTLLPEQVPAAEPAVENMLTTHATLFLGGAVFAGLVVPILLSVGTVVGQRRDALSGTAAATSYAVAGLLVVAGKVALALTYLLAAEFTPMPLPI
ncbi:dehydrogenase [Natronococcus sp. A-GB7]|uniref:dehydrogenase n=1 Tax=Natronococcus sp. A-GB7 TaxID=3037649 RepID=UPI00241F8A8F|nr:dehydrogenase [Natronococcus sp. A-GB7]MDG5818620.1 dehydrogenase [Natronococcus sp. A-GB7]